jgi:hypothetical protein
MLRSIAAIGGGLWAGRFLDDLSWFFTYFTEKGTSNAVLTWMYAGEGCTGEDVAYRLIPMWSWFFSGLSTFFIYKLFKSWKSLGGDEHYAPPVLGGSEPIEDSTKPVPVGH